MLLSVKGGKLHASHIRDLIGVVNNNRAELGGLICFDEPTQQMKNEMATADYHTTITGEKIPKIQYRTLKDILTNNRNYHKIEKNNEKLF